ncbi:hypothetical protein evm_004545 [Chilo suppressalis]|nr:hypothetical protein evm_004545 [Chilo suppressalis]
MRYELRTVCSDEDSVILFQMALTLVLVVSAILSCSAELTDDMIEYERECLNEDAYPCMEGGCIPISQYCDGVINCPDGTDENFCSDTNHKSATKICGEQFHFLCKDGDKCVPNSWLCNNVTDCNDGSDEEGCSSMPAPAANATCKGFKCDGSKCISNLWVCDGYYDCDDKTDESSKELCRKTRYNQPIQDVAMCLDIPIRRYYRCIDSSFCLSEDLMCNGIIDCRDGSDEGRFCENWHTMCSEVNNPCKDNETICMPERYGASCVCEVSPLTREYNYSTQRCEDINECALALPQCSHSCKNEDGHFRCFCDEGYEQDTYGYLCYAKGPEALLFYTTSTEIRYVKVKSKQDVVVMSDMKQVHGVSYDGKHLYWVETEQGHQAIMRTELTNIEGTKQVIVSLGLEDPGDVAVDWVNGHIYFSDVQRGTISACKADGSVCTTLKTNSKRPRYVTLANKHGKMMWADWHYRPLLMSADMDGSRSSPLVDNLQGFATGLALDEPNGRLYFVDKTVKVIKLDDMQTYSLFEEPFHHPYSIAIFENTIFWSDWTSNTIQTADKLHGTGQKRNVLVSLNKPIFGMHIYHPVIYNPIHNPCENHTCSHMCLTSTNATGVCACPDGMELKNGTNCQLVGHWTGDQKLLSRAPPYFGRYVKPLVPAASAVISTHQSVLGPRDGENRLMKNWGNWHKQPILPEERLVVTIRNLNLTLNLSALWPHPKCRRTRATRHSRKRRQEKLEAATKVAIARDSGRLRKGERGGESRE